MLHDSSTDQYTIPEGAIGIAGTPKKFRRAEAKCGKLPSAWTAKCHSCGHQIRLFGVPQGQRAQLKLRFESNGLTVLPPGTVISRCMNGCSA